jgi:RadC-like JAB domain
MLSCSRTTILQGDPAPNEADIRLTRRLAEGAWILQINMLDHVIVGQSFECRPGYFSLKEASMIETQHRFVAEIPARAETK